MNAEELIPKTIFKVSQDWNKLSGFEPGDNGIVIRKDNSFGQDYWLVVTPNGEEKWLIPETPIERVRTLNSAICGAFSIQTLEELVWSLGIDFDDLIGGSNKSARVLDLIEHMEKSNRIGELYAAACAACGLMFLR